MHMELWYLQPEELSLMKGINLFFAIVSGIVGITSLIAYLQTPSNLILVSTIINLVASLLNWLCYYSREVNQSYE
jgi:hypothetical protein